MNNDLELNIHTGAKDNNRLRIKLNTLLNGQLSKLCRLMKRGNNQISTNLHQNHPEILQIVHHPHSKILHLNNMKINVRSLL